MLCLAAENPPPRRITMDARNAREAGFDAERLARLTLAIEQDIEAERYDGCELIVGRGGRVAYHDRFGWADRAAGRRVEKDQPFITMSCALARAAAGLDCSRSSWPSAGDVNG